VNKTSFILKLSSSSTANDIKVAVLVRSIEYTPKNINSVYGYWKTSLWAADF
jgi:hypothetical protein